MTKSEILNHARSFKLHGPSEVELSFLYDVACGSIAIELGSCIGISSYVIGSVCKSISCVDLWVDEFKQFEKDTYQKSVYSNLEPGMFEQFLKNCWEPISLGKMKFFKGYTDQMACKFQEESCTLLFIDADHSYEGALKDYNAYKSKVKPGGHILFHDYGPWPGVTRLCDEIMESKEAVHVSGAQSMCLFQKVI